MTEFIEFFKKYTIGIIVVILAVLFAVIVVPLIINWSFTIPAKWPFLAVSWEAKDALAYYGSALGFIGTVIFSGLALWQNHIIKTESDKHSRALEEMEHKKNMPHLHCLSSSCWGDCMKLSFKIENISDNVAKNVNISKISIINKDGTEYWSNNKETHIDHISNSSVNINLDNPSLKNAYQVFVFRISYQDKFDEYHQILVEGKQKSDKISIPKFIIKDI